MAAKWARTWCVRPVRSRAAIKVARGPYCTTR